MQHHGAVGLCAPHDLQEMPRIATREAAFGIGFAKVVHAERLRPAEDAAVALDVEPHGAVGLGSGCRGERREPVQPECCEVARMSLDAESQTRYRVVVHIDLSFGVSVITLRQRSSVLRR